ncbi:MAG: hypothetical protein LOD92_06205 [Bacillales bacterium]
MSIEEKIDQLVAMVAQILEKQTEHRHILDEHRRILDEHRRILDEHKHILDEHTKKLDQIEQRVDKIEKHLEYISYKLSEHDKDIFLLKRASNSGR